MHLLILGDGLILEPGDIQHTPHQPGKALGLIGNDLQVVVPAVFRNGAVQNAVHIAGDGGHGGLQLVGHIGHELLPLVFAFLQQGCHVIEGEGQLFHFLGVVAGEAHTGIQVAVAEIIGGLAQIPQRTALLPGEEAHSQHSHQHHDQGGGQEDVGDPLHQGGGTGSGGGCDDDAGEHLIFGVDDGHRHHIPVIGVQSLNDADEAVGAVGDDLL